MGARARRVSVVVAIALGLSAAVPHASNNSNKTGIEAPRVLNLRLTASAELSSVSQRALVNETESIWRDANVQLRW
jgi:hypothetical protein